MPDSQRLLSMTNGLQLQFPDMDDEKNSLAASKYALSEANDEAWQKFIDRLAEWGRNSATIDEDGCLLPTRTALSEAYQWLKWLKELVEILPQRVVAAGDGGISIELISGPALSVSLEVGDTGQTEYLLFRDCQLVLRQVAHRLPYVAAVVSR